MSQPDEHQKSVNANDILTLCQLPSVTLIEDATPSSNFDEKFAATPLHLQDVSPSTRTTPSASPRKLYKRRYVGLIALAALNVVVSWCWLVFASVSSVSAEYFEVDEITINWLTTGYLFAFFVASPVAMYTLNRGVKWAMLVAGVLLLVSSWMRYGGTRLPKKGFPLAVVSQVICGFAQPFALAAPTRYSHVWFSERGRITATALASLANPLGGALGQLVGPLLATSPEKLANMVLWVAVITTVIFVPLPFIPPSPPTPPCDNPETAQPLTLDTIRSLFRNPYFYFVASPFVVFVAAFTATSSLLNQIMQPYGYSVDQAGLDGAVLIVAGLLAAAVVSPILDRHSSYRLVTLKCLIVLVAASYLALIYIPRTRTLPGPFVVSGLIGISSFVMLPLALELLVDLTHPIGPEVSSSVCWAVSQLLGGVFIIVMGALKKDDGGMFGSMVFQSVLCCAVLPLPLVGLSRWGRDWLEHGSNGHCTI